MTILNILQYPDSRLQRTAIKVTDVGSARIQKIIDDMLETLRATKSCAALAATQLNIDNPPSITVISPIPGLFTEPLCLINPEVIEKHGAHQEEEGCMSVHPNCISAKVKRAISIKVTAQDRYGNQLNIDAEDFFAKCIQHEVDHLHGRIYLDHLSPLKRALIKKKIEKIDR